MTEIRKEANYMYPDQFAKCFSTDKIFCICPEDWISMGHFLISPTHGGNTLHHFHKISSYGRPAKRGIRNFRVWQMILLTVDEENAVIAFKLYSFIKQKQSKNKHTFTQKNPIPRKVFHLKLYSSNLTKVV